jgi:hypothetical protein
MITPAKYTKLFGEEKWIPSKYRKVISRSATFKLKKYEKSY